MISTYTYNMWVLNNFRLGMRIPVLSPKDWQTLVGMAEKAYHQRTTTTNPLRKHLTQ